MTSDDITPVDSTPVDAGRVLRRAIELDQLDQSDSAGLVEVTLDQTALAEVAAEVGVSPAALAEALADDQVGALEPTGLLDRLVGPKVVWSSRRVSADQQEVRELVVEWLTVAHGLKPRVRPDGVVVAGRRRDLAGKVGRGLRRVQGVGELGSANRVRAAAVATDTGRDSDPESSVSLAADIGSRRKDAIVGGSAATAGLTVVIGVAAAASGPAVLFGLPVAAGVGTLVARRRHRTTIAIVTESVEETVDAVVQGEEPPRPRGSLVRRRRPGSEKI